MEDSKVLLAISEEDVWAIAEQEGIRIPEDKKDDVIYTVKKFLEGYCYDGAYNIWDAIKDAIKTALEDEG
jgi:formaldehyde-activating enzyme involved in methanogenesis